MLRAIFLGLLLGILAVSAQDYHCPDNFPEECSCLEYSNGTPIDCVTIAMESWNIQATFDAISDAYNNTSEVVYSVDIMSKSVTNPGPEIPANSVSTLKTERLFLYMDRYVRIDPNAFSGTHSTTTELTIMDMDFKDVEEAFNLFNNFKVLIRLYVGSDTGSSTLLEIPSLAFDNDLQNLTHVYIVNSGLHTIGNLPFAKLPKVSEILLDRNNLTLANISDTAFTFTSTSIRGVSLFLRINPGITHLPEEKFGNFLRGDLNRLYVGGPGGNCDPPYCLHCDERIDWICEAGLVSSISGYVCFEAAYEELYDYCKQKFGNNLRYRENVEDVKKIQFADRVRYETLKLEEEFRRRS